MYFLYADESGDPGMVKSPTAYFCLSGLVFHELEWHETLRATIDFRRKLRVDYGLKLREEIHASVWMNKPGEMGRIPKHKRLRLLRDVIDFQAQLPNINIINVVVDKKKHCDETDIFAIAWETLIQRYHNTISYKNFPGPRNEKDHGLLFVDSTDELKLRALVRRMRRYNPVPSRYDFSTRQQLITTVVEDPVHRNSMHSYFVQLADVNAYFLYQYMMPNGYIRRKGARNYLRRLEPILCKKASNSNSLGIVRR